MLNLPPNPKWDIARVSHSTLVNADCFDVFPFIEDKSIDAIICDLPYGTTQNKQDIIIPFDKLWEQYERVIKEAHSLQSLIRLASFGHETISSSLLMQVYLIIYSYLMAGLGEEREHPEIMILLCLKFDFLW